MARKAKNNGRRASRVIVLDRTMEVLRLLRLGISSGDILRIGREQWGLGPDAVQKYISKAIAQRKEYILPTAQEFIKDASEKLDGLFEENVLAKDRRAANKNLETKNKILGLEKINVRLEEVTIDDALWRLKEEQEEKKKEES
jgi:hypothetical protein